jgi:hypothetical protein
VRLYQVRSCVRLGLFWFIQVMSSYVSYVNLCHYITGLIRLGHVKSGKFMIYQVKSGYFILFQVRTSLVTLGQVISG